MAAPAMILGDDAAQITTSYTVSQLTTTVDGNSRWYAQKDRVSTETFRLEGAHVFWDRWQAGFSVPVVRRSLGEQASTGLGDVTTNLGYEILPEWDYSPWRPKGLGFLQVVFPSGRSASESDDPLQMDSRGRGFWSLGAGTVFTKTFSKLDLFTNFDIHRSFARSFSNSRTSGELQPGWGGNLGLGAGYNFQLYRLGAALTWSYEDPVKVRGMRNSPGAVERFATLAFSASYLFSSEWTGTVSYLDQTLIGNPSNTSLGQGFMLLVQKRWLR